MYKPKPFDTDGVKLSDELLALSERLAENVHENWSARRMAEGWTYGKERDDLNKKTPCLVSYAELDEIEKEYDRTTAIQTLKLICALGYKIVKED